MNIGEFTILWAHFELLYFNNYCKAGLIKSKVKNNHFNLNKEIIDKCKELKNELLKSLYISNTNISTEIIHEKLYSHEYNKTYTEIDTVLTQDTTDKELLIGMLLVLYRLRNNMFHGLKDCYTINSQNKLFIKCNELLDALIQNHYFYKN